MSAKPAWHGGNKIPASYSRMMAERYYARVGKRPEPQPDDMSFELKCFVDRL
jgi:hypothetical protein